MTHLISTMLALLFLPAVALAGWIGYRIGWGDGRLQGGREMYDPAARIMAEGRDWRAP